MPVAALELTRLTYRHGKVTALYDVSFNVRAGECVAVLGPSGSGKTALMRIVAGFATASEGLVTHDGMLIDGVPPHRRGFGIVQQPDALFPHLTLAENVAYPLRLRGVKRRQRGPLVETALELAHLSQSADLLAEDASAAERQRTMLARAAVFGPRILLLDDPFGMQDEAGRALMRTSIRRIHLMLGSATLLATSEASEALALANRVAVLDRGRLVQLAPPEELQERPGTARIASMLDETNLLDGTVTSMEDDIATVKLACGPLAYARSAASVYPDGSCVLAIDPSRIAVAPVAASDMGGWALDATLIETQFMGDVFRLRLLLGSGAELIVRRPTGAGLRGLSPGRKVAVAWQPYHATAFPPERSREAAAPRHDWLPAS